MGSKLSQDQSKDSSHMGSSSGLCKDSKYGWDKHYSTVYLLSGLNVNILDNKSKA